MKWLSGETFAIKKRLIKTSCTCSTKAITLPNFHRLNKIYIIHSLVADAFPFPFTGGAEGPCIPGLPPFIVGTSTNRECHAKNAHSVCLWYVFKYLVFVFWLINLFDHHVLMRFFHVVEIVGTTCELVGTSRVCFNHVVRSRACACTNVQRDASRHCRHYVIVLFHVVTCSTDAEPVCRAFLSSLLCRLLVITRKSRDCSVTWLQVVKVVTPWLSRVPSRDHKLWSD